MQPTPMFSHSQFCERAEKEISTLAAVVADAPDIALDVPSCPGWTLSDLARHTGTIHRWATTIVETEAARRLPFPEADLPWESADGLAQWLASGATPLLTVLRSAGPLTAVWSWGPGRTSGWWARRILHETTVHRADAELALGTDPVIDPLVAADAIDEFLFNLPSARRPYPHLAALPTGASLHLHATDTDGEWIIRFTDGAIDWQRGHEKATTAVRGSVTSLLLFTCGRLPASDPRLASFGDESVPALWQEKTAL
jgi:uncharacterized protein (TIGR03083 family)